jgi:hypothetical protein
MEKDIQLYVNTIEDIHTTLYVYKSMVVCHDREACHELKLALTDLDYPCRTWDEYDDVHRFSDELNARMLIVDMVIFIEMDLSIMESVNLVVTMDVYVMLNVLDALNELSRKRKDHCVDEGWQHINFCCSQP